jgi:hypothetical protein
VVLDEFFPVLGRISIRNAPVVGIEVSRRIVERIDLQEFPVVNLGPIAIMVSADARSREFILEGIIGTDPSVGCILVN